MVTLKSFWRYVFGSVWPAPPNDTLAEKTAWRSSPAAQLSSVQTRPQNWAVTLPRAVSAGGYPALSVGMRNSPDAVTQTPAVPGDRAHGRSVGAP